MKNIFTAGLLLLATSVFAKEGTYVEFKITSPSMNGNAKTYCAGGDVRSEMEMTMTKAGTPMTVTTLKLHDQPDKAYMLNDKNKTYSENDTKNDPQNKDDDFDVEVVGKERVNGYNCTHVNVVYRKTGHKNEMWLSKDIPGYNRFTSVEDKYLGGSTFFNKLKEKGADGFVARMVVSGGRGDQIQMDLVKAEVKNLDGGMFSLDGYTKSAGPGYGGMSPEQIKAMTPEQRQQYIQQMRERYQKK